MAKIDISTRTPGIFKTNRRKCGWGAALTTCDICGRLMMGHNRGVCSKCMRSRGRNATNIFTPQRVGIFHLLPGVGASTTKRLQAAQFRELYANGGTK